MLERSKLRFINFKKTNRSILFTSKKQKVHLRGLTAGPVWPAPLCVLLSAEDLYTLRGKNNLKFSLGSFADMPSS